MTAKDLKNALLQEAVQGRLVPQLASDGNAADLLKQIRAEKARLIKEGKIKKEKPLPEITDDEIPFDIPENWCWTYVGELFAHNTGKAMNSSAKETNKKGAIRKFITTSNLYWDEFDFTNVKEMFFSDDELARCTATKGDILICEGGAYYGRTAIWNYDYDICFQNHIHRLRPYVNLDLRFYYYCFYLYRNIGFLQSKGTAMPGLSSVVLHNIIIPLPPLAEQKRIVAAIERFMPLIEEYGKKEEELRQLNASIGEQAKKALLQEAVQGRLVPQMASEGNARDLLKQIQAEKAQLIKEGKLKKEKPLPPITDDEIPFDIPENWCWCRLGEICELITKGSSPSWQGVKYVDKGILFITSENVGNEELLLSNTKYLEPNFNQIQNRSILKKGDILTNIVGASIGRSAVFDLDIDDANINQAVALIRLINLDLNRYLIKVFNSQMIIDQMTDNTVNTARANISLTTVGNMLIPLPPLTEQKRIVSALEQLLPLCERLGR